MNHQTPPSPTTLTPAKVCLSRSTTGGSHKFVNDITKPTLLRANSLPVALLGSAKHKSLDYSSVGHVVSNIVEDEVAFETQKCAICLDMKLENELSATNDICQNPECKESICNSCIHDYLAERVSACRFALVPLPCAVCRCKLPVDSWQGFAHTDVHANYLRNAADMLAFRCPSCHSTGRLDDEYKSVGRDSRARAFFTLSRDAVLYSESLDAYLKYDISADALLNTIRASGPPCILDASPERRVLCAGTACSRSQFVEWFDHAPRECMVCGCSSEIDEFGERTCWCDSCQKGGCSIDFVDPTMREHCVCDGSSSENATLCHEIGLQKWEHATTLSPAKRPALSGREYSLAEFEYWYGQAEGRRQWADAARIDISRILSLVADVERRTTLYLAHLRQHPRIRTPCCGSDYCFRCQTAWHENETCEEIAAQAVIDVQFCPSCSVPTQRTEGCSSMVCLCGATWTWAESGGDAEGAQAEGDGLWVDGGDWAVPAGADDGW